MLANGFPNVLLAASQKRQDGRIPSRMNVASLGRPMPVSKPRGLLYSTIEQNLLSGAIHFIFSNTQNGQVNRTQETQLFRQFSEDSYLFNKQDSIRHDYGNNAFGPREVCAFLLYILHYGFFTVPEFIISLIYLSSFKKLTGVLVHIKTWRPLVIVCLLLADKMWEDKPMQLKDLAKLFPLLSKGELKDLENFFIEKLAFKLIVSPYEFANFCQVLIDADVHPDITRIVAESEYARTLKGDLDTKGPPHHDQLPCMPELDLEPVDYHSQAWTVFFEARSPSPPASNLATRGRTNGLNTSTRANSAGHIPGGNRPVERQPEWATVRKTLPVQTQQKTQHQLNASRGAFQPLQRRSGSSSGGALPMRGSVNQFSPPPSAISTGGTGSPAAGGLTAGVMPREHAACSSSAVQPQSTSSGRNLSSGQIRSNGAPSLMSREPLSSGRANREGRSNLASREMLQVGREGTALAHSNSGANSLSKRPDGGGPSLSHSSSGAPAGRETRTDSSPSAGLTTGPSQFSPRDNLGRAQAGSPVSRPFVNQGSAQQPSSTAQSPTGAQWLRQDGSHSRSPEPAGVPVSPSRLPLQATPRVAASSSNGGPPCAAATPVSQEQRRVASGTQSGAAGTPISSTGSPTACGAQSRPSGPLPLNDQFLAQAVRQSQQAAPPPRVGATQEQQARGRSPQAEAAANPQNQQVPQPVPSNGQQRDAQSAPADAGRRPLRAGLAPEPVQAVQRPTTAVPSQPQPPPQPQATVGGAPRSQSTAAMQPSPPATLTQRASAPSSSTAGTLGAGAPRGVPSAGTLPTASAGLSGHGSVYTRPGHPGHPPVQVASSGMGRRLGAPTSPSPTPQGFMSLAGRERSSSPAYQVGSGSLPATARVQHRVGTPTSTQLYR